MRTKLEDATEMVGEELAILLEEEEKKRLKEDRKKGRTRSKMVIKSEGGTLPSYITTMKDAENYLKNLEMEAEFGSGMSLLEGIMANIIDSGLSIVEKEKLLSALLEEARKVIASGRIIGKNKSQTEDKKMGYVSTRNAISLSGALRNLADSAQGKNYQVSLGAVVKEIERAIMNLPTGQREKAHAQLREDLIPYIETERSVKKGSVRWYAMINSGLSPETGRPIEEIANPTLEQITEKGIVSIEKAIRDSAARQAQRQKPKEKRDPLRTPGTISARTASRRSSGLSD